MEETATLAGGCFWCTEAIFKRLKGVTSVIPGYTGGVLDDPSYEEVLRSGTGHVEAVQVKFDPRVLSFQKLLEVFFALHDPTTMNKQGYDEGTQYRSAIFYRNDKQKKIAEEMLKPGYVTEIRPLTRFYPAEEYHRNFYENNPDYPYCRVIIDPKIQKLIQDFPGDLKT
ncbi:peptide-methionine (S)-S-oxide reductase MsrA [Patescibacteria group bacterium]|nr:peptide-methionine (S)-S-oxide reductase MsrA [Patescibacteria group bacterium]